MHRRSRTNVLAPIISPSLNLKISTQKTAQDEASNDIQQASSTQFHRRNSSMNSKSNQSSVLLSTVKPEFINKTSLPSKFHRRTRRFTVSQFQQNFIMHHEHDDVYRQIRNYKSNDLSLYEMLGTLETNIKTLIAFKNSRVVLQIISKICEYQPRFQEVYKVLFEESKTSEWTQEIFLQRIVLHFTKLQNKKLVFKRRPIDAHFVQQLQDFCEKIESSNLRFCNESYKNLERKIMEERMKLNGTDLIIKQDKEQTILKQSKDKKSFNQSVRGLIDAKYKLNIRLMLDDTYEVLTGMEEKFGPFNLIKGITRHTSNNLNSVIYNLQNTYFE